MSDGPTSFERYVGSAGDDIVLWCSSFGNDNKASACTVPAGVCHVNAFFAIQREAGLFHGLAVVTSIIVVLPRETWEVLLPVAWPFPILLWLAVRSRPVFAAAGAFLVSNIIVGRRSSE